jgi:dimethylamine monooxygenase subunit A
VVRRQDGKDWTCAIHVCFPHMWTAEGKIGQDFVTMHQRVPGMDKFRRPGMVNVMIDRGPNTRFVWGLQTDSRLNHHPEPPPTGADTWPEQPFDPAQPRLFLRVEREVLWGLPQVQAAFFTVRTYFTDCEQIRRDPARRDPLCAALESMDEAAAAYKGLLQSRGDVLTWLRSGG